MQAHPTLGRRRAGALALAFLILAVVALLRVHPFLAVTERVPSKVMVIEGWIPDYALEAAVAEYREHGYTRVYTTGGPLEMGSYVSNFQDFAHLAAATLVRLGLPEAEVEAVPTSQKFRNRTYSSAVALRDHWRTHDIQVPAFNLVTEGAHARRSRLCFRRAMGQGIEVGVMAIENRDYDSDRWWRFSAGIKTIMGESLAVFYAWLSLDYGG